MATSGWETCIGHSRRNGCGELYVPAESLECEVEDLYATIRLPDDLKGRIVCQLEREIATRERGPARVAKRWGGRLAKLAAEREKLIHAYYADAIPLTLLKAEQPRIDAEVAVAEQVLRISAVELEAAREIVRIALRLMDSCHKAYRRAGPATRRRFNQTFFKAVRVRGKRADWAVYDDLLAGLLWRGSGGTSRSARPTHGVAPPQGSSNRETLVDPRGFEPLTSWLPAKRSTS